MYFHAYYMYVYILNELDYLASVVHMLVLAFDSKALRDLCEKQSKASSILGHAIAEKLKHRVADLRAVANVAELTKLPGSPSVVPGSSGTQFAINLCGCTRVVFCANHTKIPVLHTGEVDWSKVSRIRIQMIGP